MGFLLPGEEYDIESTIGPITCKALSFQQQRELIRIVKSLQTNTDPEEAMNLVEKLIEKAAVRWTLEEAFSVALLLEKIGFQEAMDIGKKITEGGKLSEDERKK
jgi:hypothetical protein